MEEPMIALYYCYKNIPVELIQLQEAQVSTCNRLGLKGRIRLSSEGVNGVLSGDIQSLKEYEDELRSLLFPPKIYGHQESDINTSDCLRYGQTLDVKYCHMRHDIPREKQLFDSLQVSITKDIVTLIDQPTSRPKKKKGYKPDLKLLFDQYPSSPHLTPEEWNQKLLQYSMPTTIDDHNTLTSSNGAILIDVRNIYESSIGRFQVHGVPILLTNTRNYSDLTDILEASINQLSGRNVFLYCTGGVRCERVSSYLQAFADSEQWPKTIDKPKNIYQLQGGIQKYLETYGSMENSPQAEENPVSSADRMIRGNSDQDEVGPCLYIGKNFVFDQRRYDPMVGSECPTIGKCLLCGNLHDDYDNGNAPADNKEARCCCCRILILVCNTCRQHGRVWGEEEITNKPSIFCGKGGTDCTGQGNKLDNIVVIES